MPLTGRTMQTHQQRVQAGAVSWKRYRDMIAIVKVTTFELALNGRLSDVAYTRRQER